jgi:hypothetical protein
LSVLSQTHLLRALREQPLWRLLAADKAPAVLEQERIPWQVAVQELKSRLAGDAGDCWRD